MQTNLPPALEMFSRIVDGQPPNVHELFHYALAMLLVENHKAEVIERRTIDLREYLTLRTVAGELFTIVKPDTSDELLEQLTIMARAVLREENGDPNENTP